MGEAEREGIQQQKGTGLGEAEREGIQQQKGTGQGERGQRERGGSRRGGGGGQAEIKPYKRRENFLTSSSIMRDCGGG